LAAGPLPLAVTQEDWKIIESPPPVWGDYRGPHCQWTSSGRGNPGFQPYGLVSGV